MSGVARDAHVGAAVEEVAHVATAERLGVHVVQRHERELAGGLEQVVAAPVDVGRGARGVAVVARVVAAAAVVDFVLVDALRLIRAERVELQPALAERQVLRAYGHTHEAVAPAQVAGDALLALRSDARRRAQLAGGVAAAGAHAGVPEHRVVGVDAVGREAVRVVEGQALTEAGAERAQQHLGVVALPAHEELGHVQAGALPLGRERVARGVVAQVAQAQARGDHGQPQRQVPQRAHARLQRHGRRAIVGWRAHHLEAHAAVGGAQRPELLAHGQERRDLQQLLRREHARGHQRGRVVEHAGLLAVGQDGVHVLVGEVGQRIQRLAVGAVQVHATAHDLHQRVPRVLRDLPGGEELLQVLLVVHVDEHLVLHGTRSARRERQQQRDRHHDPQPRRRRVPQHGLSTQADHSPRPSSTARVSRSM